METKEVEKSNFMRACDIIHGYEWSSNSSIVWALGQISHYSIINENLQKQELEELPKVIEYIKRNNISKIVAKKVAEYFE